MSIAAGAYRPCTACTSRPSPRHFPHTRKKTRRRRLSHDPALVEVERDCLSHLEPRPRTSCARISGCETLAAANDVFNDPRLVPPHASKQPTEGGCVSRVTVLMTATGTAQQQVSGSNTALARDHMGPPQQGPICRIAAQGADPRSRSATVLPRQHLVAFFMTYFTTLPRQYRSYCSTLIILLLATGHNARAGTRDQNKFRHRIIL